MKKMILQSTRISLSIVLYVYFMSLYFQFCVLHFLSKLNMTLIFVVCLDTLWIENFNEIARSHTVTEIQAVLRFTRYEKMLMLN